MKLRSGFAVATFVVLLGGALTTTAGQISEPTSNASSTPAEVVLQAESGPVLAAVRVFSVSDDAGSVRAADFVAVPGLGLAWVGYACDRYACFSNAIVGLSIDSDRVLVNRQTIAFRGTPDDRSRAQARMTDDFKERAKGGSVNDLQTLYLGEKFFGHRGLSPFLPPSERVRPSAPPDVEDMHFDDGKLVLTLVGEKTTRVVLIFDSTMTLVSGTINGERAYPPQEKQPGDF